jgi:hypothetical protein
MRIKRTTKSGPLVVRQLLVKIWWVSLLVFYAKSAGAGSVTLAWDRHSSHTNLSAFVVKYGGSSGSYTDQVSIATNLSSTTVSNLVAGQTYYFAVTALTIAGMESDPSNEVVTNTPVRGTNFSPVAIARTLTTAEDQSAAVILSGTDPDGDPLTYSILTTPLNGTLNGTAPNLTYLPNANFSGTDTFVFQVSDGLSNSGPASVSITVNAVNDSPTLVPPSNISINEDAAPHVINLAGIGAGAANESQTLTLSAASSNTGLIPNPTITYSSPNTTGSLSFVPVANANGSSTITVTVNDGQSLNNSFTCSFTVVVNAVNDIPTLAPLTNLVLAEDSGPQTVNLTGISSGAANENQTMAVTVASSNPSLIPTPTINYNSPAGNGSLIFKPNTNGTGAATLTVTLNDGQSLNNTIARTFTVTVAEVNDAPTISSIADQTISEGNSTTALPFLVGDVETAASNLTLSASSSNLSVIPNANVVFGGSGANRTVTVNPAALAFGTAMITVQVQDGSGAIATESFLITVNAVNQAPTLGSLANVILVEDTTPQTISLVGISSGATNESDTLTVTASSSNLGLIPTPTISYTSPNSTGTLAFAPVPNASGTAIITVTVNDNQSQNNTLAQTFTVTINPANDLPTLNPLANLILAEDAGPQTINLSGITSGAANETQNLIVTATSSNPSLVPNPTVTFTSPSATGTLTLRPVTNATGTAAITVTVNDGQIQNNTVTRSFVMTVTAVNDLPTASGIANQTINENTSSAALPFVVGDVETPAGNLTVAGTSSNPTLVPSANIVFGGSGANRTVTVTPVSTLFGSAIITIQISDSDGGVAVRTFTLTVNGVNQAPTLNALSTVVINEDAGTQAINLSGISSGAANESQTLTITASSSNPTLIPNPIVTYISPNSTGILAFTPITNANGSATISVTVNDGGGQNNTITRAFTVTVNSVNDAPTISEIADQSISQNSATGTIPFSVADAETASSGLTIAANSSNPTLVPTAYLALGGSGANRTIKVTPMPNQFGSAVISLTVLDGTGGIASESFVVNVIAGNLPPTLDALNDVTIAEDATSQSVTLTGISSGAASEDQTLSITVVSSNPSVIPIPTLAYASPNATGTLTFVPVPNAHGTATITVTINDGQSQNNLFTRFFTVNINAVNDTPTLNVIPNLNLNADAPAQTLGISGISSGAVNENQNLTVTATSSDPSLIPNPNVNYFSPNTTGSLGFTPASGAHGTATITVTVDDAQSENNIAIRTFTISVRGTNNPPSITDVTDQSIPMGTQPLSVAFVVADGETAATNLEVIASSSNPTLIWSNSIALVNNGSNRLARISTTPGQDGVAVITFTVTDADGATASDSFVVTVIAPNTRPTLDFPANMVISEDSGEQTVILTGISDGSTNEHQILILSATSNNPELIPHPTVHYVNPGTTGTLTFTPVTNKTGVANITIKIDDGQSADNITVRSFTVGVNANNDAPTISAIPNQLVELNNATSPLPFTIGDAETLASNLGVSATSSDSVLVPNDNILMGGTGANRSIKVTPAPFQSGTATITIFVTDGSLTAAGSFLLTVGSTNTPPVISAPASLSTDSYTTLQNVGITVNDLESRPQDLVLSATSYNPAVVPSANIVFSGSGSNRTATITPVAGKSGPVSISLAVSDGRTITRTSCQLTVSPGVPPKAKLSVRKKGNGTVEPALDGQDLTIGQSYTLTAVPAAEEVFTGWSGTLTSGAPVVTFVMASNFVLEASFTNSPYTTIKGPYNGLFHEAAEVRQTSSGSFNLTPTERGTFTGKIKLGSKSYSLSGRVGLDCKATNTIVRTGENTLTIELDFASGSTNQVVGRVSDGTWEAPLMGDRAVYNSRTNTAPYVGAYTLIIPGQDEPGLGPQGTGFATVRVDGNGLARFVGMLADGTKISQRVYLSQSGQWPFYVPLYRGQGSVLSWLTVTNRLPDDISGLLSWIKPSVPGSKYSAGFTNEAFVAGSMYIQPTSGSRVLNLSDAHLIVDRGNLPIPITNSIVLTEQNKILNLSENPCSITISVKSGLFVGHVVDPSTGTRLKFLGVTLQKQSTGSGFALGSDQNSRVSLW